MSLVFPRLKAQIVKEFLSILRDPRSRIVLVGPPLIQLLVFSFAATLDVTNIGIAIHDRDAGRWSHELVARVTSAGFVGTVEPVNSADAYRMRIDRQDVLMALDIPETFSRDIAAGRPAGVQVIVDGRRANAGQVALGYLQAIVDGLGADLRSQTATVGESSVVRNWFNPNLIYRWFIVPSLAGILTMIVSLLVTALSIARERELGTFDQLLVSPTTPTEIIIAKSLPALVIGVLLGSLMVGAGAFGFRIPFTGSVLLLFASLVLFILSMVGVGLMISSICSTQQQAILGAFTIAVPMILMSGFATPVENMPWFLRMVAEAIPLKHFLIIVQGSFLKALPPADVFANAWPMAVIALVTLSVATVFVRSKLQ